MQTLIQINIYPVKSLDGYSPSMAKVEPIGLQFDRRWMVTDRSGNFITQRSCSGMTGLRATVKGDMLVISSKADAANFIEIDIHSRSQPLTVRVWDDCIAAFCMGKEVGDFLSEFLHQDCRLVCLDPNSGRQIDTRYAATGELLSFADAFPFMIIGEASFADLNTRLSSKFLDLSRRFRPNLIFTGGMPYDEDRWDKIKIGNAIFSGRKNCGRCVMINLDPDAGMSGAEPLKTLSAFRKSGNSVLMGRHLCLDSLSQLSDAELLLNVGDLIEVISLVKD